MNATQEVREQYKNATRNLIRHLNAGDMPLNVKFYEGRTSGLSIALSCLGVNDDEVREMYNACEEEAKDERAQEDVGPGDVNYDEEGFVVEQDLPQLQPKLEQQAEQTFTEQEELDAIERPASQAQVEEDIYECEHCNAEFRESEILRRDFGGETGGITFCPRCKEATKLICVTGVDQ